MPWSSSSTWLILSFLIEFLKSYLQIILKKKPKHITIAIVCKTLRKTSSWMLTIVNHGRHWVPVIHHVFSSPPASELQRAVSLLGTDVDTSQLQNTLWVTKGPLEFSLILSAGVSLPKRLSYVCLGNRKRSKATTWRRRLTNWWRRSVHYLSAPIRYWSASSSNCSCWYQHGFSMVCFSARRLDLQHMVTVTQFCFVPSSGGTDPNCNTNVSAAGKKRGHVLGFCQMGIRPPSYE